MKFYWHILVTTVSIAILLIKENSCVPAIRPLSQRGIIYPVENWDDCFLDDNSTQPGLCKTIEECPDVLKKWHKEHIYPKTCYFVKKEQFVCCPFTSVNTFSSTTPADNIFAGFSNSEMPVVKQRASQLACDLNNQQKFGITVVNGKATKSNEFPFMAALGWKSNSDNKIWYPCGGVLIAQKFVLTAAHCAEIGGESPSFVLVGGSNLTEDTEAGSIKIKQFIKFPGYNITTIYNDIALVELDKEVNNSIACLWTSADIPFTTVTALGYGHTRFAGSASENLLKASLHLIPNAECQKFYKLDDKLQSMDITESHMCAGDPEHLSDTCQGDSGGPLIMEFEQISYVLGITSFGLGCAGLPPSIYTRVSTYVDWIESIIWPDIDVRFD